MATAPLASTPCTWNQCLARSRPMVVTCMADGSSRCGVHRRPGCGTYRCRERGPSTPSRLDRPTRTCARPTAPIDGTAQAAAHLARGGVAAESRPVIEATYSLSSGLVHAARAIRCGAEEWR